MSESGSSPQAQSSSARAYQSATSSYRFVMHQPSWVLRWALIAAGFVLIAVLAVIIVPAVIVGLIVFALGALAARVRRLIGGSGPRPSVSTGEGRENVRVIVRSDAP
ncbi:MAG: hypothetical protein K2W85_16180 [Phycisphaerales bacterium]|nr:hypothetical protein [Phycisphaerales bacterium]